MSAAGALERGRASHAHGAWKEACEALSRADRSASLHAEDLERLATAAYMLGVLEDYVDAMERAHRAHLDAAAPLRAARCAFWIGMQLLLAGEAGRGTGWIGRAQRLVDAHGGDCVERGYLCLPQAFRCQVSADYERGAAIAGDAVAIASRFGDGELLAIAIHVQGHMLIRLGRAEDGLALLDEAMVAATGGELSPIATGVVYCGVILGCQDAHEYGRAREWTEALTRWCERQPDMVAFTGRCGVHRAQLMQLAGAWSDALREARSAADRAARGNRGSAYAEAAYVQGEVHRLRGAFAEAEDAYRTAGERGREPQPGHALLRLAQGDAPAAAAALRRALAETRDPVERIRLLPAYVEILLEVGDVAEARSAADELGAAAGEQTVGLLPAIAAQARGAVALASGAAQDALPDLRDAWRCWDEIGGRYEAARAQVLVGAACRELGDRDAAERAQDAAARAFRALGALPDAARLERPRRGAPGDGLTDRELEVLRLVAAGCTNRAIGAELVLSERTVDRHVSNILAKLRVSSRAAATAHAYEHRLLPPRHA